MFPSRGMDRGLTESCCTPRPLRGRPQITVLLECRRLVGGWLSRLCLLVESKAAGQALEYFADLGLSGR